MRFLILGGTGPSGILFIRKALEVYPDATVVIYARSPEKVPEDLANSASITIIKGQLDDADTFSTAVEGVDVVLSALGPLARHPAGNPIAKAYELLFDLMNRYGVKRVIGLGTASIVEADDKPSWKFALLIKGVKTLAPNAYSDIVAVGEAFHTNATGLDWTIVRVPFLTNGDSEAAVAGYVGDEQTGTKVSRKAFAAFVVGEVEKQEWVRGAPMISSP